jgi:hypothetical protein
MAYLAAWYLLGGEEVDSSILLELLLVLQLVHLPLFVSLY